MPPELERLYVLTLAADEAVRLGQWDTLTALLAERARLLDALEESATVRGSSPAWERARQADARLVQTLANARTETVDEIARANSGRRVASVYTCGSQAPLTDRVS